MCESLVFHTFLSYVHVCRPNICENRHLSVLSTAKIELQVISKTWKLAAKRFTSMKNDHFNYHVDKGIT